MEMTSRERAYLKGKAMKLDAIFQIGKASLTPELVTAVSEALAARELIKISVLQNCGDSPAELAQILGERTKSQVVQVIGKKIVLYRKRKEPKKKAQGEKHGTGTKRPAGRTGRPEKSRNHGRDF